mmetsp:Transcript_35482/g.101318  ORF Transcript_35482/g.101318 Transcript_35482/m.101318 type:complete len:101 (-) Transcript_35482:343-645(-)
MRPLVAQAVPQLRAQSWLVTWPLQQQERRVRPPKPRGVVARELRPGTMSLCTPTTSCVIPTLRINFGQLQVIPSWCAILPAFRSSLDGSAHVLRLQAKHV